MFSIAESVFMCGMSAFQVWGEPSLSRRFCVRENADHSGHCLVAVVQRFFSGPSRRRQV